MILVTGAEFVCARRHKRMTDLVIGHNLLFLRRNDGTLALIPCDDNLHAFLQIGLGDGVAAHAHRAQRCFIDDVCQLGAGSTSCGAGDGGKVNIRPHFDILSMHAQNCFTTLEIRKFHGNASVEAAGAQQCLVKRVGAVCGGQNHNALASVKTVHFREQLVQRLFPLIVSGKPGTVALFADGVDLIDKHDAGRFVLRLFEEVSHLGCAHADKHFYKFRTGNREEGHMCFTGDSLCQQCFACAGRANQQGALRHGSADGFDIFSGCAGNPRFP